MLGASRFFSQISSRRSLVRGCRHVAAVASCAWLTACATYHPQPISPPELSDQFQLRRLDNPKLRRFLESSAPALAQPWPRASWSLPELTAVAFFYHPDLEVARAQWASAMSGIPVAGTRPNPTFGVTPGYNFNAGGRSPWFPGVTIDVPIETAGKRRIRITRSERAAFAARLNVTTVAWQLRSALREALTELTASRRRAALLQAQADVQRRILDLLQSRQSAGAASLSEVSTARLAVTKLRVDAADAERQTSDSWNHLAESLGVPLAALQDIEIDFRFVAVPAIVDASGARRLALQQRSDIRGGLADYELSEADLEAEVAKQYPDIHLGSGYQWDQGDNKWNLAASVELPVFNHNQAGVAQAEAKRREAAARFRALQAKTSAIIDRAIAAQLLAVAQRTSLADLHRALDAQVDRMRTRLAAGDIDQLEYQNSKLEAATGALALLDSEVRVTRASGELEDALQVPFPALSLAEGPGDPLFSKNTP